MTVGRMYLALVAAAVAAGCWLHVADAGVIGFSSPDGIAEAAGRATTLFLMAALIPTALVLLARNRKGSTAAPTAVGVAVLAVISFNTYRAAEFDRTSASPISATFADHTFSPPGCDFAVSFPIEPKLTSVVLPGLGETPEAEISDHRGLMRANCLGLSAFEGATRIPYYDDPQLLLARLQAYAEQNGLRNASYTHEQIDIGMRASARGTKQIDGTWVTYEAVWFVSPKSVMGLLTGHISESYPTREISRFLDSVTRIDHPTKNDASQSTFVALALAFNVAIDMPRDWWVLDDAMNRLIRTSRDAALDLTGIQPPEDDEAVLIAANSWPPQTYAALRVTRVQPPLGEPEEVRGLTALELAELGRAFEAELTQLLTLQGLTFLEAIGIRIEEIGGWPAIVFSYRRSGSKGPVVVSLIQVSRKQDLLRINLSYRESERVIWMPVIERIKRSIQA